MTKVRQILIAAAILLLCCLINGCNKEEKPGSIYGVVTDFSTNEPVAGANVQLRPSGETTLTGSDGMFEILEVPNGDYSITVSKAGYTDLVDDYIISVKDGKKIRRDVQIKPLPASLHIYDNDSHEISELDFGSEEGVNKKTFNIFNEGTRKINFEIEKSADWITNINPSTGTVDIGETKSIVVTIDRKLLTVGDNTTTLNIASAGEGSKDLTIKAAKSGESPTVSILEALEVDSTTFRIKCEVVSGGGQTVTERGICWNTYGDPMMDDEIIKYSSGGLGQYPIRMEHLSLSTHYFVRAYAKNDMGIGFSEVLDFVTGTAVLPPSVSTVEIEEVTATTAVCIGNVSADGGSDLTECGVCWSKNASPTIAGLHQAADEAALGVYSVTLTGLTPNTTYHVRCYAINAKGTGYGEDLTLTTSEGLPKVITLGITDITATSAKGGGEVTDEGASAVTERGICWSKNHTPTTADSHANSGTGTGSFTVSMTELKPNETYYVRAYAKNHLGTSYGAEVNFMVLEGLPAVTTLEVDNVTASSAKGHGNVTDQGGSVVTERGICWSTEPSPTITGDHANSGTGQGLFSVSIDGLIPGTKYYVRAYAKNTQGLTYGEQKEFTTNAKLPTVTTNTPSSVLQNTATGGGDVTDDGGATVTERGICWSTSHNPTVSDAHGSSGTGTGSFTVEMTALDPGTKYYVRAYATNSQGTSYGSEKSLTTLANLPSVITAEVSNITQTTAQGGGNVTNDGGATVTERGVCWSTSHNPTTSGSHLSSGTGTGSYTCDITGLTANTKYYIRAYAVNSQGTSYGSELSFMTSLNVSSPTVTTSQVTDITETTATGGGNVTDDGNATVTERGVCWSTSHNPTTSGSHASSGSGTGSFTVNITGLTSDTKYYVRSYAINSTGTSYGREVSFTTLQVVSSPTVTTSQVTNITQTTATGGGNVTSDGNATVTERGVCWSTSHNPSTSGSHASASGGGTGSFTVNMTGLTANTTYYVRAYATNSQGTSYGSEVSFTTSQVVTAPTVTTSQVTNITQTTATGGGNVTSDGNATVTERGICWSTSHNPSTSGSHASASGGGTGSFTVSMTGLTANTTYYVRAYATNSQGTSYGSEVSFTTATIQAPTGAINGLFSVSTSQQVWFSQGNLQYKASTSTWKFADHQWDVIGESQNNGNQNTTRDQFGWGTSGYNHGANCYQPWSTSTVEQDYWAYGNYSYNLYDQSGKADWGYNAISNGGNQENCGWRTLTMDEWVYVFNTRTTTSGIRYAKACVNGVNGVILVPDDWNSSIFILHSTNTENANCATNTINETTWNMYLAPYGCVFLPAAGRRYGISVGYVGSNGYYWSATSCDSTFACYVYFNDANMVPQGYGRRYIGLSVRLVRSAQ